MPQSSSRTPAPAAAETRATVRPHIVGAASTFAGRITHAGRVEVWGLVRGHVRALEVSIKHGGKVDGQVEANLIRNDGSLSGTVRAQRLETSRRSRLSGEIKISEMGMEIGCRVGPNTQIMTPDPKMIPVLTADILSAEIAAAETPRPGAAKAPRPQDDAAPPEAPSEPAVEMARPYLVK